MVINMIQKIKMYFKIKKIERDIKHYLLTFLFDLVNEKDKYITFVKNLATNVDYTNFQDDLVNKLTEFYTDHKS